MRKKINTISHSEDTRKCQNCGKELTKRWQKKCCSIKCSKSFIDPKKKSFGQANPKLIKEWHPTKNGKLTPYDFYPASNIKVWWKCQKCGYEWEAKIGSRNKGYKRCKKCNCLATKNPELAKEWHPTKNDNLTPYDVMPGSRKKAWWLCFKCKKEWKSRISHRNHKKNPAGCPRCHSSFQEERCRFILEQLLGTSFPKRRSIFGGKFNNYELDGYNEKLDIAFEHSGKQHYEYIPYFHKKFSNFKLLQKRDKKKKELCRKNHIKLITIPYTTSNKSNEILVEYISDNLGTPCKTLDWKLFVFSDNNWDKIYNRVKSFVDKNNKIPSSTLKNREEKRLGDWVGVQRQNYKKTNMLEERINKLEKIPKWFWDRNEEDKKRWNENYNELKIFIRKNKRNPYPNAKNKEEEKLGRWRDIQKMGYRDKKISEEKIKKLEKIPEWSWCSRDDLWSKNYKNLIIFIKKNKRLPSDTKRDEKEKQLGTWCNSQRERYKKKLLLQKRINKLEKNPEWYWKKYK